jgi:hypothetical protein
MKVASAVRVGMPADDVLKMRGRSSEYAIAVPTEVDKDEMGYVVAWHYFDCDVLLHWRNGCYRVREVLDVQPGTNAGA